jgi:hypothetical protein
MEHSSTHTACGWVGGWLGRGTSREHGSCHADRLALFQARRFRYRNHWHGLVHVFRIVCPTHTANFTAVVWCAKDADILVESKRQREREREGVRARIRATERVCR